VDAEEQSGEFTDLGRAIDERIAARYWSEEL